MKKFFRSLLAKYMLIILMALFLFQISLMTVGLFVFGLAENREDSSEGSIDYDEIEETWHDEAAKIKDASKDKIRQHFEKWKQQYPEASMFWVDENGRLAETLDIAEKLPAEWTSTFTAGFIKERYGGEPFTVIAFLGEEEQEGFIVLELPREVFQSPTQQLYDRYGTILSIGMFLIISLFIIVSFLFFWRIRKRLLHLQEAMTTRDGVGLPVQTKVKKKDEIGQLEQSFNEMVEELRESKQREQEEEQLRKELIANLSHDLRTPLTKIRSQTYSLEREPLTAEGQQSVKAIENSVSDMDRLIENLMSYTLLMASKYNFESKEIDVVRYIRECLASWYSVFERERFDIEIDLHSFENNKWRVDPEWLSRIIDNLLQNILRHARTGRYVGVKTESTDQYDAFVIMDRGSGMQHESTKKGAGIGLSIVDMMVKGMNLDWELESSEHGTTIKIKKLK